MWDSPPNEKASLFAQKPFFEKTLHFEIQELLNDLYVFKDFPSPCNL